MANTYKTGGRERLINFLAAHPDTPYTVDSLAACLQSVGGEGETRVSKSSLYRQLSALVSAGQVRRDAGDTSDAAMSGRAAPSGRTAPAVYRYIGRADCAAHIHLQCVKCGHLYHLDCTLTDRLLSHIRTDHHFSVDPGPSLLYGVCERCEEQGTERID